MPISVEDLFRIPLIYSVDLAADGNVMLYSLNSTGIPHLYSLPTKPDSKPKQVTSGNDPVIMGLLSPKGDNVLYLQDKDGNELHNLFLIPKEGGKPRRITKKPHRTLGCGWHPNDKEVARSYVTKKSCVIEVLNVKTGENFVLKEQKAPFMGLRYSHNGKWIACTEWGGGKDPKNLQVTVVNRKDPKDTIRYKLKDGSKETTPSWSPDDKKLAFLSDAKGKNQVVIQEFQGKEHLFLDLEEGEEVFGEGVIQDIETRWTPKGDKVYYIVSKHSRTKVYEHSLKGKRKALPFPEGTTLAFKMSENGKKMVVLHSSLSSPHGIYLYEVGSDTVTTLTSRKFKVDITKLAKPKSVWYKSSDGLKIHAWYLPAKHGASPHSAVIWPHGGPWWQTYDTWSPYMQSASQSGFGVLAPNFRGSTGYGAEFRNMDLSDPGGGDLEDVVSGAKWLAKQSEIDGSRIAIMGGSYGGFMTLTALTRKPEVFAAGVALVPVTDWLEMYGLSDAIFRTFMDELFEGPPKKKEKLYRDRSPITHISKIKAPVMIIAGRNDSRCPIQPIEKFVKKLKEMKHPHEFRVQEKEGHGFMRIEDSIKEVTTSIGYLKKTLHKR